MSYSLRKWSLKINQHNFCIADHHIWVVVLKELSSKTWSAVFWPIAEPVMLWTKLEKTEKAAYISICMDSNYEQFLILTVFESIWRFVKRLRPFYRIFTTFILNMVCAVDLFMKRRLTTITKTGILSVSQYIWLSNTKHCIPWTNKGHYNVAIAEMLLRY